MDTVALFLIAIGIWHLAPSDRQWWRLISVLKRIADALEKKGGA